jgi:hypothetical protein
MAGEFARLADPLYIARRVHVIDVVQTHLMKQDDCHQRGTDLKQQTPNEWK